jgi:hypothetical protein
MSQQQDFERQQPSYSTTSSSRAKCIISCRNEMELRMHRRGICEAKAIPASVTACGRRRTPFDTCHRATNRSRVNARDLRRRHLCPRLHKSARATCQCLRTLHPRSEQLQRIDHERR